MTTPDRPDELLTDDEIERLLSTIVDDPNVSFPRRAHLRERMLDELERSDLVGSLSAESADAERSLDGSASTYGSDAQLIELGRNLKADHSPKRAWLPLVAAAAVACAGTVLGMSLLERQRDSTDIEATSQEARLVPIETDFPAAIEAGLYRTDVVGSDIAFELPDNMEVIDERPGLVVLGRQGDAAQPRAQISIVQPDRGKALAELVVELDGRGLINPKESLTVANEQFVTDWELRLTSEAADTFGCTAAGPCAPLGPIELWSQSVNFIAEVTGPNGEAIWWVEQSSFHLDPFLDDGTDILASLRFE